MGIRRMGSRVVPGLALGLVATGLVAAQVAAPATADTNPPPGLGMTETVSSNALPAPQISGGGGAANAGGVVWATEMVGNTVYAGGNFTKARPDGVARGGAGEVDRANILAFDVRTGALTDFDPALNGQVKSIAVSPNQQRLYVGGEFRTVDGQTRNRIAAFDTATGALVTSFAPSINGTVDAIVATNTKVYVGGPFAGVGNQARQYAAAFDASNGALLDWAPTFTGGPVTSITANDPGTKIALGGYFRSVNGKNTAGGYGLAMVDATTAASLDMPVNRFVRNARPAFNEGEDETDGAITSLSTDGTNIYGTGFVYQSKRGGTLEGVFAAKWSDGSVAWINDCHGDAYDVAAAGGVVYSAGHAHYCENIDGVRQGPGAVGDYPYYRAIANTVAATGTASWEPDQGRYADFSGQPAPTLLGWYPSLNAGDFTGQSQGPWTVTGNNDYVVFGGEFTRVDNAAHEGLVVFGKKGVTGNANSDGPEYFNASYPLNVSSTQAGQVRVNWPSNRDADNENLTYVVQRRPTGTTDWTGIHTRTAFVRFWNPQTMGYTDTGVTAGTSYDYRVSARDASGNSANSAIATVVASRTSIDGGYVQAVYADEPTAYWRLGDPVGTTAADRVGFLPLTTRGGVTQGFAGAVGDGDAATAFNGADGTAVAGDPATSCTRETAYALVPVCWPPDVFTLETWFSTTTQQGGRMVGWSNRATGNSSRSDRMLYMSNDGRVRFGVKPDDRRVAIASKPGLNDGGWHHAVGVLSKDGMVLYVDGVRVASRSDVTVGEHLSIGAWRLGGDNLAGWPGAPTSGYFAGALDEVAVYKTALAGNRVTAHYNASGRTAVAGGPSATFGSPGALQPAQAATFTGSGTGGTAPLAYEWDFGDGTAAAGATASKAFATPGRYEVTLTVTDAQGRTGSFARVVKVLGAPVASARVARVQGSTATISASASVDPDGGTIPLYTYEWGDGTESTSSAASSESHVYRTPGTYTVTVTVTDDEGVTSAPVSLTVTAPNAAPTAAFTAAESALTVTFDGRASTDSDGTIASYVWRFTENNANTNASGPTATKTYAAPGTYPVRLTVTDDDGVSTRFDGSVVVTGQGGTTTTPPTTTTVEVQGEQASAIKLLKRPTLKGTLMAGKKVAVRGARWNTDVKVGYQWFVDGKAIKKARSSSLKLTKAMVGKKIKVVLTAKASGLRSVKVTVTAKGKVKAAGQGGQGKKGDRGKRGRPLILP